MASPGTTSKDLEGISDNIQSPPPAKITKQRKIAVLTSGGDSAGMNAAGEHKIPLKQERHEADDQFEQSFDKVSPVDAKHSSSEKDGKV
jgi:hypothetical protein